jgi:hypothetical protein
VTDAAAIRSSIAAICLEFARLSGDGRFNAAAAMLQGKRSGRRCLDDSAALAYAEKLLSTGIARTRRQAALKSAKIHASGRQVQTMAERLRKKLGGN